MVFLGMIEAGAEVMNDSFSFRSFSGLIVIFGLSLRLGL